MSNGKTYTGRGKSDAGFRHAATLAIKDAEKKHARSGAKGDPPAEYELTFHAKATPGHSLSEYIVIAKGSI
jgi:hypothetical protein